MTEGMQSYNLQQHLVIHRVDGEIDATGFSFGEYGGLDTSFVVSETTRTPEGEEGLVSEDTTWRYGLWGDYGYASVRIFRDGLYGVSEAGESFDDGCSSRMAILSG